MEMGNKTNTEPQIEYFWCGKGNIATPNEIPVKCVLCGFEDVYKVYKDIVYQTQCPDCLRKSLTVENRKQWKFYFEYGLDDWEFYLDQYYTPYGLYKQKANIRLDGWSFEAVIRKIDATISDKKIKELISYCKSLCLNRPIRELHIRSYKNNGSFYYDCADGHYIELQPGKWERKPILSLNFRDSENKLPFLVERGTKEDWLQFKEIFNIENKESRILFEVWAASCFIPHISHPILVPTGEQGAAKSTMSEFVKNLIDPSNLSVMTLTKDTQNIMMQLQESYVVAYDNISQINNEQSDLFCQAITGFSYSKRKLFTDADVYARKIKSILILNGINTPTSRADLVDRTIVLELSRISKQRRKTKQEISEYCEALIPKVRSYLLDTVCSALTIYDEVKKELAGDLPRMADWAIYAEAIARTMGYDKMEFVKAYANDEKNRTEQIIDEEIIAKYIIDIAQDGFEGTPTELYNEINSRLVLDGLKPDKIQSYPRSPAALTRKLTSLKTTLTQKKIVVIKTKQNENRIVKINVAQSLTGQTGL